MNSVGIYRAKRCKLKRLGVHQDRHGKRTDNTGTCYMMRENLGKNQNYKDIKIILTFLFNINSFLSSKHDLFTQNARILDIDKTRGPEQYFFLTFPG